MKNFYGKRLKVKFKYFILLFLHSKIELCGRINYCQNVLLLNAENIKIIGGQVEGLVELEHYLEILRLKL